MNFIRGLLLYNTVYWKRASDGLKPPELSRRDRQSCQPARDLEIIRPRERPRARLAIARSGEMITASPLHMPTDAPPEEGGVSVAPVPPATEISLPLPPAAPSKARTVPLGMDEGQVIIKRRRARRRKVRVLSSSDAADPKTDVHAGLLARLFKRGGER